MSIGTNIKKIREADGIDLSRLADLLKVKPSLIEAFENGKKEPSVSDLLKIAGALGTDIAALIYGKEYQEKKAVVTRLDSRQTVERKSHYKYESLAPFYRGKHIEPFTVEIYRQKHAEKSMHEGEEFHYVLEGILKIIIDKQEHILDPGDTIYFDSSLPHSLEAVTDQVKVLAVLYNGENMIQLTKGRRMRELIHAAKVLGGRNVSVACPDQTVIKALDKAIEEGIVQKAYLVGDPLNYSLENSGYQKHYEVIQLDEKFESYHQDAAEKSVALIKKGNCHMIMKGNINTAIFVKAVLDKSKGISSGRRLSLISLCELPNIDRFIFLTDPAINPALVIDDDLALSQDIIHNAIDLAHSLGVVQPKVALLEANEVPTDKIPSTIYEKELSELKWDNALVYGPLSYDLALYEESVQKKGLKNNSVAGKADILVVPYISGGNFLYKSWAITLNAETANVVIGAKAPIILTSRNDSEMNKFLTICASAVYSQYVLKQ